MAKKQETKISPVADMGYPRYMSNHLKGADLYESKSQERLAQAVAAQTIQ